VYTDGFLRQSQRHTMCMVQSIVRGTVVQCQRHGGFVIQWWWGATHTGHADRRTLLTLHKSLSKTPRFKHASMIHNTVHSVAHSQFSQCASQVWAAMRHDDYNVAYCMVRLAAVRDSVLLSRGRRLVRNAQAFSVSGLVPTQQPI
jgi:hypothetical protein